MLCFAADLGRSARWPIASSWRRSANEIAESPFVGEGHRKIRARLALRGIHTSGKRVLRLTRGAGLLAPTPQVRKRSKRLHDAKITVEVPDTLWATDATEGHTRHDGRCAVFAIINHASGEAWVDAAARMDRWAAADLLRGAHHRALRLGRAGRRRRPGAALRRRARASAPITTRPRSTTSASPAARPSTTSPRPTAASRSSSRLKEQVLWIERFDTHEQLRARIRRFATDYNKHWLLERHRYRTPAQAHERLIHHTTMARASRSPTKRPVNRVRRTGETG